MKTPRRTVTIVITLAAVSFAVILTVRVFAQAASKRNTSFEITIGGDDRAKLKSDYQPPDLQKFDDLLNLHSKKFDLIDDKGNHHKPKQVSSLRSQNVTTSEIIKVQLSSTPTPTPTPTPSGSSKINGPNVTQNVSTQSASDMAAILAAFE